MSRTFSISTDVITVAPSASINNLTAFTIAAWVLPLPIGAAVACISSKLGLVEGGWTFGEVNVTSSIFALSSVFAQIDPNEANGATSSGIANTINLNQWNYVLITYNGVDHIAHIFVNGTEIPYKTESAATIFPRDNDSINPILIGNDIFGEFFVGSIAEYAIWNTVLTQAQITSAYQSMNGVSGILPNNLVAYLHLQGAQNPEPDSSGNNNSGVVTGTSLGPNSPGWSPSVTTGKTIGIGTFGGSSITAAFKNPSQLDIIQVKNEGGDVVWNLTASGSENINPSNPTKGSLYIYFGASFTQAFGPNPNQFDIMQVVAQGNSVVFRVTADGSAQTN